MGGFAASRVLDVHGERMIARTSEPGFRIGLHGKDLDLALSSPRAPGVSLPGAAIARQLFNAGAAQGGEGLDHAASAHALRRLAAHPVA
jgi:2-hydroxy-3-oxopropionate reductase